MCIQKSLLYVNYTWNGYTNPQPQRIQRNNDGTDQREMDEEHEIGCLNINLEVLLVPNSTKLISREMDNVIKKALFSYICATGKSL